jgi:RNA-splicing ligase RtcB
VQVIRGAVVGGCPQGLVGARRYFLDEIPAAYKDINEVIAAQTDLVEVVTHLRQVVCVKG